MDDLIALAERLKSEGRLSEFMEAAGLLTGLFNCSTFPCLAEGAYGNLYRRQMVLDKTGAKFEGHLHNFDHITYLIRGKVLRRVREVEGGPFQEEVFQAPCSMLIRAKCWHEFIALSDDVIAECVYPLRNGDTGEFISTWDGDKRPYV